jgi:predicted metal-dependent hydrolase
LSKTTITLPDLGLVNIHRRKGLKNIRISIDHNGFVRLSLPWYVPKKTGLKFLESKKDWLKKQQNSINQEKFKIHGYNVVVAKSSNTRTSYKVINNLIIIHIPENLTNLKKKEKAKSALEKFLKNKSEDELTYRLKQIARSQNIKINSIKIKKLKSRWGSCDSKNNIVLNLFLAKLPSELSDYVIAHELAHTKHMNHGKNFWEEVEAIIPDYRKRKKALAKYRPTL